MLITKETEKYYKYLLPFGYYREGDYIEVSNHYYETIQQIFSDYVNFPKLKDVIIKHKVLQKKTMRESYEYLRSLISNTKYKGTFTLNSITFPFPAIVSEEIWDLAQIRKIKNEKQNKLDLSFEIVSTDNIKNKNQKILFNSITTTKYRIAKISYDNLSNNLNCDLNEVKKNYDLKIFFVKDKAFFSLFTKNSKLNTKEEVYDFMNKFIEKNEVNQDEIKIIENVDFKIYSELNSEQYKLKKITNKLNNKIYDEETNISTYNIEKYQINFLEIFHSNEIKLSELEKLLVRRSIEKNNIIILFVTDMNNIPLNIKNILLSNNIHISSNAEREKEIAKIIISGGLDVTTK